MNFKRFLAVALTSLMVSNTVFASPNTNFAEPSCTSKITNTLKNAGEKVVKFAKDHPVLASTIAATGVVSTVAMSILLKDPVKAAFYYWDYECCRIDYRSAFKDTKKNSITPRQEGDGWCAIACLAGLLKYKGFEVEQKDIYKSAFKTSKVPIFECNRKKGGLCRCPINKEEMEQIRNEVGDFYGGREGSVYQSQFDEYVKKVSNNKLRYQELYIPYNIGSECIINAIKSILEKYKKVSIIDPFALETDSYHFVNIVDIDNDKNTITVEDPGTRLSRVQNIRNFVEGYHSECTNYVVSSVSVHLDPGLGIGILTENENLYENGDIKDIFYVDPKNCSEGFSLLKKHYSIKTGWHSRGS